MKYDEFKTVRGRLNVLCETILNVKGDAYARDAQLAAEDRLGNFKRTAELVGVDPLQVAGIFLMKHIDSLLTWVTETSDPQVFFIPEAGGESVEGRFADARNYVDLLFALAVEQARKTLNDHTASEDEKMAASRLWCEFGVDPEGEPDA